MDVMNGAPQHKTQAQVTHAAARHPLVDSAGTPRKGRDLSGAGPRRAEPLADIEPNRADPRPATSRR